MYMSISVLGSHIDGIPCAPNHDPLDDIESFYCVLYDFMCSWKGIGQHVAARPKDLDFWDVDSNPALTHSMKKGHFFDATSPSLKHIPDFWTSPSIDLLRGFYRIVRDIVVKKLRFAVLDTEAKKDGLRELLATVDSTYEQVLHLFDKVLDDLAAEASSLSYNPPVVVAPRPSPPPVIVQDLHTDCPAMEVSPVGHIADDAVHPSTPSSTKSSRKRSREQDFEVEGSLPTKRSRRSATAKNTFHYSPPRTRAAARAAATAHKVSTPPAVPMTRLSLKIDPRHQHAKTGLASRPPQEAATRPKKKAPSPRQAAKARQQHNKDMVTVSVKSDRCIQKIRTPPVRVTRWSVRAGFHRLES